MKELGGMRYEVCGAKGDYKLGDIYDTEEQARAAAMKMQREREVLLIVKMTWHRKLDDDGNFVSSWTNRMVVGKVTSETT